MNKKTVFKLFEGHRKSLKKKKVVKQTLKGRFKQVIFE